MLLVWSRGLRVLPYYLRFQVSGLIAFQVSGFCLQVSGFTSFAAGAEAVRYWSKGLLSGVSGL